MSASRTPLPFVTPLELRTGGAFKSAPEDFEVEELPAYEPSGEGEHLYLWIEKRDVSAEQLLGHVARQVGCTRGDIGAAGMKDRRAVTRQWLSVPARCEPNVGLVATEAIRVLEARRHRNKLRTGHLRGNRFRIRLRGAEPQADRAAAEIAALLERSGVPNIYGEQRFGHDDETLTFGLGLLRGTSTPRDIPPARRRFLLRLALSAVQSALFNETLASRIRDGLLQTVLAGDVMQVSATGGLFVVDDVAREQPRFDDRETVITGPMFGPEMKPPGGDAADREAVVLAAWGLTPGSFETFRNLTPGARRPLLFRPGGLEVRTDTGDVLLQFELPSGAYATSVVREFRKTYDADGTG
ncbi:MAG: tRNA pseudouridine(13) synthase TruD [Planctomyces sp.]|nr:tRNA pseudouridine(13) synthase TruD [Planctomyces sp.]